MEKVKNYWLLLALQYRSDFLQTFFEVKFFEVKLNRENCTATIQRFLTTVYTHQDIIHPPKKFTCVWPTIINHFLNLYHHGLVLLIWSSFERNDSICTILWLDSPINMMFLRILIAI